MRLLLHWVLNALGLLIVAHIVPGFYVRSFGSALIAALVIGLINATVGTLLKILTFPLALLTLGIFWFVINALMLMVASAVLAGFKVDGFLAAFLGAVVLALVNALLHWFVRAPRRRPQ